MAEDAQGMDEFDWVMKVRSGERFSASHMRLWHSPCQHTPLGCNLCPVSACRLLQNQDSGTPSRYLANNQLECLEIGIASVKVKQHCKAL